MIDDLRKLIFIHMEKTGGTSIAMALFGRDEGAKRKGSDLQYDNGLTKHYSVQKARQVYGEEKWVNYTKFSVVRNPWDRLVSKWCWRREGILRKQGKLPILYELDSDGHIPKAWFAEEIREECKRWQLKSADDFLFGPGLIPKVDHVLRFESLESDWNNLVSQTGWSPLTATLPHVNRSTDKATDYRLYYSDETADIVSRHFARTIAYWNYSF